MFSLGAISDIFDQPSRPEVITMRTLVRSLPALLGILATAALSADVNDNKDKRLTAELYFQWEEASDPQISPDGSRIVYVRRWPDVMTDRRFSNIWTVSFSGSDNRPLTTGEYSDSSPRWSPDGRRLAFISNRDGDSQIYVRWMDTGQITRVTDIRSAPSNISWSPDGSRIAFTALVPSERPATPKMLAKPEGAKWADPPVVIDRLVYRADGRGYLPHGFNHIFVVPSEGGSPRQLTTGDYEHATGMFSTNQQPCWTPDGKQILFSATRKPEWEWIVGDSEIYALSLSDGNIRALTTRQGPDSGPVVSPDGKWIAYTGFDEKRLSYTVNRLYVMGIDGSNPRLISETVDNDVRNPVWAPDGRSVYFTVGDRGSVNVYTASLDGKVRQITQGVHQIGNLSMSSNGFVATTLSSPTKPGDIVSFALENPAPRQLTFVNDDLLETRVPGKVEEIWYKSSFDGRNMQGWIVKPPDFDPKKKYPLILYIHGGPHSMYGVGFDFEFQVHAAAGYVVLYTNPRGSTGYGQEFGNLIQYNYPGDDYFDLVSGVDELLKKGYIDSNNLFVTGGSGGGVLTCWVIGRTNRFAAAVSQFPVINWYSFVGTADFGNSMGWRWFRKWPWEDTEDHMKRSPIALVGNVTTPTLLITGEADWRTPISETEQYFRALKLQKKEARMVRVPDEPHGIRNHPSHYIAKILFIQDWFEKHKRTEKTSSN
jgi:dipeptidyl aminopeptidase/acylaminoacyl peptidase